MSSLSLGLPAAGAQSPPSWRGRLHAAALMLAVPAAVALAWHHPDPPLVAYGVVLVALFAVSAAYHLLRLRPATHQLLRRVDHVMIFLYMATAYAPLCLRAVRGAFGWVILGLAWAVAAAGIALKTLSFARTRVLTGLLYMVLGWLAVLTLPSAVRMMGPFDLALFAVMGALYTGGAVVLARKRPDPLPGVFGYHEIWHAAVVLASACYFAIVWSVAR